MLCYDHRVFVIVLIVRWSLVRVQSAVTCRRGRVISLQYAEFLRSKQPN